MNPTAAPPRDQQTSTSQAGIGMRVQKRNGDLEPVDVNKIVRAVALSSEGLDAIDPLRVATRTTSFPSCVPVSCISFTPSSASAILS